MVNIKDILLLPKEEQVAILEAIQTNLEEEENGNILNEEQVNYIKNRVHEIKNSDAPVYSWDEMKQKLNKRWDTK